MPEPCARSLIKDTHVSYTSRNTAREDGASCTELSNLALLLFGARPSGRAACAIAKQHFNLAGARAQATMLRRKAPSASLAIRETASGPENPELAYEVLLCSLNSNAMNATRTNQPKRNAATHLKTP